MTAQAHTHLDVLDDLPTIGLDDLMETAALQTRRDRKYLLPVDEAWALLDGTAARVLEIDGLRSFDYESIYFDTASRDSYLGSARRRPRRFKVRTRTYLDTQECLRQHGQAPAALRPRSASSPDRCGRRLRHRGRGSGPVRRPPGRRARGALPPVDVRPVIHQRSSDGGPMHLLGGDRVPVAPGPRSGHHRDQVVRAAHRGRPQALAVGPPTEVHQQVLHRPRRGRSFAAVEQVAPSARTTRPAEPRVRRVTALTSAAPRSP